MELATVIVVTVIVVLLAFFIFREFWCWYFKINERIDLDQQILDKLRELSQDKGRCCEKESTTRNRCD